MGRIFYMKYSPDLGEQRRALQMQLEPEKSALFTQRCEDHNNFPTLQMSLLIEIQGTRNGEGYQNDGNIITQGLLPSAVMTLQMQTGI